MSEKKEEKGYSIRSGCGIRYKSVHPSGFGKKIVSGFSVDNLDTKTFEQASTPFERLFIIIRTEMENNESLCMDDEDDRLTLCQAISDRVYKNFTNLRESKVQTK